MIRMKIPFTGGCACGAIPYECSAEPETVVSGTRYGLTVELISDLAYTLAAGHRLGLIITSSNFPRFAQNPNNGDPFIGGSPPVFVTNTLYLDGMSAIVLAVGP
jgi:predicted acyl esterase